MILAWIFLLSTCFFVVSTLSRGQQTTEDGCFQSFPYSRLNCAREFERRTGVDELRCRSLCTRYPSCAAVNYRLDVQQCDLFPSAVGGVSSGWPGDYKVKRHRRDQWSPEQPQQTSYGGSDNNFQQPQYQPQPQPQYQPQQQQGYYGYYSTAAIVYRQPVYVYPTTPAYRPPYPNQPVRDGCGATGPTLFPSQQHNFYRSTGKCVGISLAPPPPPRPQPDTPATKSTPIAGCQPDTSAVFTLTSGLQMVGGNDSPFPSTSAGSCSYACKDNKTPDGTTITCNSAQFNSFTQTCYISANSVAPKGTGQSVNNDNFVYMEKLCLPTAIAQSCPGPYRVDHSRILQGLGVAVAQVPTLSECIGQCLNSQSRFSITCKSGVFDYNSAKDNCILNVETKSSRPALFVPPANGDQADYFETGCSGVKGNSFRRFNNRRVFLERKDAAEPSLSESRPDDDHFVLEKNSPHWGRWTVCDRVKNVRIRFRFCQTYSPKSCVQRQEVSCTAPIDEETTTILTTTKKSPRESQPEDSESPCRPVRTSDGVINCTVAGSLLTSSGKTVKCVPDECD